MKPAVLFFLKSPMPDFLESSAMNISPSVLAEYWASPGTESRLHILVRIASADYAVSLRKVLATLPDSTVVPHSNSSECLMSIFFAAGTDIDTVLQKTSRVLNLFNRREGGVRAEILKAGMVRSSGSGGIPGCWQLSDRFYAVADKKSADKIHGRHVILNPGHAFGSGFHPSTRLAIKAIEDWARKESNLSRARVLDIGTGSGVLALICGELGVKEVLGIDICRESIRTAQKNVTDNELDQKIKVAEIALTKITSRFDLVLANLTPAPLARMLDDMVMRVLPGGTFIISGQQGRQVRRLEETLKKKGFSAAVFYEEERWYALRLMLLSSLISAEGK